jgi:hypothetical protein
MPPWSAEAGSTPFKGAQSLSAREFDVIMTWAAGGMPEGVRLSGSAGRERARSTPQRSGSGWALGAPDAIVSMPAAFALDPGQAEEHHEVVLPADDARGKWIRAVDLKPGTPSIVRSAEVAIRSSAGEQIVGLWLPGDAPHVLEGQAAFGVPPDASLVLRVRYKRSRPEDAAAASDRSQVALYFAPAAGARGVRSIEIGGEGEWPFGSERVFTHAIDRAVQAVALRPISGPADATVRLTLVASDGSRTPLARMQLRHEWPRRYVFAAPVALPAGSRIEVHVSASRGMLWETLTGDRPIGPLEGRLFRFVLEATD